MNEKSSSLYLHAIHESEERRIEVNLLELASEGSHAVIVKALQSLRGVAFLTAVSLAAEIGSFRRLGSPMQLKC